MNAVIYARYSSDNQREESIEGQLRECKEYADQNGITVVRTYIDRALSAKTDNVGSYRLCRTWRQKCRLLLSAGHLWRA